MKEYGRSESAHSSSIVAASQRERRLSGVGINAEKKNDDCSASSHHHHQQQQQQQQEQQQPLSLLKLITQGPSNVWVRLVIYCIACFSTSCLYYGWQDYSRMLLRSGAFAWKCPPGTPPFTDMQDPTRCDAQSHAVDSLYAVANGSEFAFAAVAGILLDSMGPRLTALIGEILHMVSIIMLSISSHSLQLYIPGLLLAGASVNIVCFPALTVIEHWPSRQALTVSLIVGCQSSASLIPPILNRIWLANPRYTYRGIWLSWLAVVWLPVTLIYLWAVPRSRDFKALMLSMVEPDLDDQAGPETKLADLEEQDLALPSDKQIAIDGRRAQWDLWKAFGRDAIKFEMIVMIIYFGLQMFQFAYYPAVVKDAVSTEMSDLVGWITPLQGPLSLIIGFMMDYCGTLPIMYLMSSTLLFVNLSCALGPKSKVLMRIVAGWFTFVQSATYNVKYTFVNETFDPYNFGKLVGVLGLAGGIGVYCSSPLTESSNYRKCFLILVFLSLVMAIATTILVFRLKIQKITHKKTVPIQQRHRTPRE